MDDRGDHQIREVIKMAYIILSAAFCFVGFAIGYAKGVRDCFDYLDEKLKEAKRELRELKDDTLC